jgi:hypothetical protein
LHPLYARDCVNYLFLGHNRLSRCWSLSVDRREVHVPDSFWNSMSLILILVLPFLGSLCAAVLPSNARNAEAWQAGVLALACTVLIASLYL